MQPEGQSNIIWKVIMLIAVVSVIVAIFPLINLASGSISIQTALEVLAAAGSVNLGSSSLTQNLGVTGNTFLRRDGSEVMTGGLELGGYGITNTATGATTLSRAATLTVCASNAKSTAQCDYIGDGTNDDVEIEAALNALPSTGGRVLLSEGQHTVRNITVPSKGVGSVGGIILEGQGPSTVLMFTPADGTNALDVTG